MVDEVEQALVRPVEVLEDEHERVELGQALEEPPPGGEALGPAITGVALGEAEQRLVEVADDWAHAVVDTVGGESVAGEVLGDAVLGLEDAHYRIPPVAMSGQVRQILREEVERAGAPVVELPSGAGHDAAPLGGAGVEAGMLFVRSLNGGASHSPQELSSPEDIAVALEVITATLRRLSNPK